MNNTLVLSGIPEDLNLQLKAYLAAHPGWDQDRAIVAALSLFLLQDGNCQNKQEISRIYLSAQFGTPRNN